MARLRRKACIALFLFTLFIFGTMMGLRTLKPSDGFSDLAPGLELMPFGEPSERRSVSNEVISHPQTTVNTADQTKVYYDLHIFYYMWYGNPKFDRNYIHWDHVMVPHWDPKISASYPKGRHSPPEDIGSSFYPELGPYSSKDPGVLEEHMKQLREAAIALAPSPRSADWSMVSGGSICQPKQDGGDFNQPLYHGDRTFQPSLSSGDVCQPSQDGGSIHHPLYQESRALQLSSLGGTIRQPSQYGDNFRQPSCTAGRRATAFCWQTHSHPGVLVLSWYPPGTADENGESVEELVPLILEAAMRYNIKVAFHIQPYKGRDDRTLHDNIKYIIDNFGSHAAFYRYKTSTSKSLPLFYIYDSYLTPPESWANLLTLTGSHSIRNTPYDAVFIGLLVEEGHKHDILTAGYDGIYTYFASNGFSFGSSHQNWKSIKSFCDTNNLMFIPSVGPGYIDTSIRPWNNHNTRNRVNGKYYETALQAALTVRPEIVSITSFNEWHEGTQIEKAMPKKTATRLYLDYLPHQSDLYLILTRKWAEHFNKEKEQWLM